MRHIAFLLILFVLSGVPAHAQVLGARLFCDTAAGTVTISQFDELESLIASKRDPASHLESFPAKGILIPSDATLAKGTCQLGPDKVEVAFPPANHTLNERGGAISTCEDTAALALTIKVNGTPWVAIERFSDTCLEPATVHQLRIKPSDKSIDLCLRNRGGSLYHHPYARAAAPEYTDDPFPSTQIQCHTFSLNPASPEAIKIPLTDAVFTQFPMLHPQKNPAPGETE